MLELELDSGALKQYSSKVKLSLCLIPHVTRIIAPRPLLTLVVSGYHFADLAADELALRT